ncbi:MAG: hypothetical protein ABIR06_15795 [Cyclobacteriaceae bacterium]
MLHHSNKTSARFSWAMPAARAIRTSPASLLPTHGVYPDFYREAFHFYPYCFANLVATHIVQATHATLKPKLLKECNWGGDRKSLSY